MLYSIRTTDVHTDAIVYLIGQLPTISEDTAGPPHLIFLVVDIRLDYLRQPFSTASTINADNTRDGVKST